MQDGQGRVHVVEEKLGAFLDHLRGEEARRGRESGRTGRGGEAIETAGYFR